MTLADTPGAESVAGDGDWFASPPGAVQSYTAQRALLVELLAHEERIADLAGRESLKGAARRNARNALARNASERVEIKKLIRIEALAAAAAIRKVLEVYP